MNSETQDILLESRQCYCLSARKQARMLTRRYEDALRPHKLRATQFSILAVLAQTGALPHTRLAEILGLERTTLTRVAEKMATRGLLTIRDNPDDARVSVTAITPTGTSTLTSALPAWKRVQDEITNERTTADET